MTDADLKKKLSVLPVPPVDPAARECSLHRALVALAQPPRHEAPGRAAWLRPAQGAAFAAIAVAAVLCAVVFSSLHTAPAASVETARADLCMLAQVQSLFPGQLNAVIERDGEVQLDLASAQAAGGPNGQPLLVQLENGGHQLRVLSYSGRTVTLELKGARLTFEALVTGDGGVVLAGADFVWSPSRPGRIAGYRIHARPLGVSL